MRHRLLLSIIAIMLLSLGGVCAASEAPADIEILKKIAERLKKNDETAGEYGFSQESKIKEFNSDGEMIKEETRTYKTEWINDSRYMQLIKVNGKEPEKDRKKDEEKRKKKFIKETQKQKDLTLENKMEVTWDDLVEKYDFVSKEPEDGFAYVISFHPKTGKKKERNRMEKILNHISGTIWVDSDFYVLKARVHLLENVKYGLGILANVENVELQFAQKRVADVWLPDTFHLKYKARVLVKTRTREIHARFFDFAPRNPARTSSAQ